MELEEFERDLKVAYLNYENNDLKETLNYLNRMLKIILKGDKSLENDPFWKNLTCDVFKAVILNNFYNKKELTINDLDSLLVNEEMMNKNIKEFCNNFRNNDLIYFITNIENITEKSIKDVIEILMTNIGKMNILSTTTLENDNIASEESKNEKITQYDIIEIVDNKSKEITTYDIELNTKNVVNKMDVSYWQDGKEVQEERIIFAFEIIDINDAFITIKTNPMCEVKDGKINLNYPETIFKLTKNSKLCLHTPTMDGGSNFELIIKEKNSNNNENISNNEQLIEELSNYVNNNSGINIFDDWYSCKEINPQFKEFFDETEKEAIEELDRAKDKITVLKHSLNSYIAIANQHRELNNLLITYFGLQSIYDRKLENDNGLFESLSVDNVGFFRAVLVMNIVAIMYHISDDSLPMGLKIIFEKEEFVNILGPILKEFLPKIIPSINEIKFFYK